MYSILVDGRAFSLQAKGGVSQIWAKIIAEWVVLSKFKITCLVYSGSSQNIHFNDLVVRFGNFIKIIEINRPSSDNQKYFNDGERESLFQYVKGKLYLPPDMVINTYYGENIYPECKRYFIVCHDFAHEQLSILKEKPSTSHVLTLKAEALNTATAIVCISNSTFRGLNELYPSFTKNKIVNTVYHGHDPLYLIKSHTRNNIFDDPRLIYVGSRAGYKGFSRFIKIFPRLLEFYPKMSVLVLGGEKLTESESKLFSSYAFNFFAQPTDEQIYQHLADADIFFSTSSYEGFGLPVLYSMALGKRLILSDIDVYRELADNRASFVNWDNDESVFYGFKAALRNCDYLPLCRTWGQVAREYMDVIERGIL